MHARLLRLFVTPGYNDASWSYQFKTRTPHPVPPRHQPQTGQHGIHRGRNRDLRSADTTETEAQEQHPGAHNQAQTPQRRRTGTEQTKQNERNLRCSKPVGVLTFLVRACLGWLPALVPACLCIPNYRVSLNSHLLAPFAKPHGTSVHKLRARWRAQCRLRSKLCTQHEISATKVRPACTQRMAYPKGGMTQGVARDAKV